jgi:hypothetical protein
MFAPGFEPKPQEPPAPLTDERKRALHILTHHGAPLFVVIDAAREAVATELLQPSRLRYQQLFEGQAADPSAAHFPVLVELGQASALGVGKDTQTFLETLLRSGWGNSWGIFCTSQSTFEDLLGHFRSFLLMRIRFYDPRVLRALLPTCEPQELRAIFGPVASYVVESERPDMMLAFSPGADRLITAQVSLAEPAVLVQAQGHAG